jgi:hypothetical protein
MKARRFPAICCLILSILMFILFTACEKAQKETLTPDRDIAETLASALAINTGGIMDQIADLCEFLASPRDMTPEGKGSRYVTMNKTYNDSTQEWTIVFEKARGVPDSAGYAHIHRTYLLKYLNAAGNAQRLYVTEGDTARTVTFKAVSGYGDHITRRISNRLDSLNFDWTVTNANQPYVTLTGMCYRAGADTISGWNKLRVSDHNLTLNFSDFQVRRAQFTNTYQYHSGLMTGTCNAVVTFISGSPYGETTISRNANILIGNGRGEISLDSVDFTADLAAGELID